MPLVAVIEGDDAAPEAVQPVVQLLSELDIDLDWIYPEVGSSAKEKYGDAFPKVAKDAIDSADTCLFGATSGLSGLALNYLRWGKETYANVRPCRYIPGCASPLRKPEGIDFAIVRENLEDLYVGLEGELSDLHLLNKVGRTNHKPIKDLGEGRYAIKAITEQGTERVVRFAFELARKRNRQLLVTCATKHNMLRISDGYFLDIATAVATDYPDVEFNSYIVDDFACRLIRMPEAFDVVVTPNLYGDILSDAAGGLLGSLGLAASGVYGDDYAYFEPAHGTAPDIAGQNIINPTATLLSAMMMLEYIGFDEIARSMQRALDKVYESGTQLTPDQGGSATTTEFVDAVKAELH